jgi:anti-sigma B factor antagonist
MSSATWQLSWTERLLDSATVVELAGEMDIETVSELIPRLRGLGATASGLVIDMTGVTFCDSSGLTALVAAFRAGAETGGWVRLVGLQPQVRTVYDITGLAEVMPEYPTVDAALEADGPEPSVH